MSDSQADPRAKSWENHARSTRRKVNLGWWLEMFAPFLVIGGVVYAAAILYLRSVHKPVDWVLALAVGLGALVLSGLISWILARRRFVTSDQGMVRLESKMGLHNALSTAKTGRAPWPEKPAKGADDGMAWRWSRVFSPFLITALLVTGAFFVPVAGLTSKDPEVVAKPRAWEDMDSWLDTLEESDAVEEQAIEDARERLEKLTEQKEDDWFSHSSLEATDTLRESLKDQIQKMGQDAAKAERSMSALAEHSEKMSSSAKDQLMGEFQEAMEQMGENSMAVNEELMNALGQIDPSQIPQLSPEQLQQMQEALQNASQAAKDALGNEAQEGLPPMDPG